MKRVYIFSMCKEFGETVDADLLVSIINRLDGYQCTHWGLSSDELPKECKELPDLAIVFFNWYNMLWNDKIIKDLTINYPKASILIYTDHISGYDEKIKQRYKYVKTVAHSLYKTNWEKLLSDLFIGHYNDISSYISNNDMSLMMNDLYQSREDLVRKKIKHALVISSKYCYEKCTFCQYCKEDFQFRKTENVIKEIETLKQEHNIRGIHFDDNLYDSGSTGRKRVLNIAEELINKDMRIPYSANFSIEFILHTSQKEINKLVQSGLYRVYLGIESMNYKDLKLYGKSHTIEDLINAINKWRVNDIDVVANLINFNPYTDLKSIKTNLDNLLHTKIIRLSLFCTSYFPIPHTEFYNNIRKDKLIIVNQKNQIVDKYKFRIPEISLLFKFITKYYYQIKENGYDEFMDEYEMIAYILCITKFFSDDQVYRLILDMRNKLDKIYNDLQVQIHEFIYKLIELIEKGWSEKIATNIANEFYRKIKPYNGKTLKNILYQLFQSNSKNTDFYLQYL